MLSTNAINALKQMSEDTPYNRAFPLTNKAGGSKANRDAVAELKKGEYIKTYTNDVTPDGCVMVKMCKKAKEMLSSMGEVGYRHAGTLSAVDITWTNSGISTMLNEDGRAVASVFVEEIREVRIEGTSEVVRTAKLISERKM